MTPVLSAQGMVAVEIVGDDVVPTVGLLQRQLVQFVGNLYNFAIRPEIPANAPPEMFPILQFQQGAFPRKDGVIPVQQLLIFPNGDAIAAADTDLAEEILEHYLDTLDQGLSYRNKGKPRRSFYTSTVVIDLEVSLENSIAPLKKITELLSSTIPRPMPFDLKGLAFGGGGNVLALTSPAAIQRADFTIQKRIGAPAGKHRYFCSAPMRTADHYRVLGAIEEIVSTGA